MKKVKIAFSLFIFLIFSFFLISCEPEVITYTVTFMNEGNVCHTATVIAGQTVGEITAPETEEGKRFDYWSLDGTNQFDFNTLINSNITLYAVWEDITHTVVFMDGDVELKRVEVAHGKTVEDVPTPTADGKEFKYWSEDEINEYGFTAPITKDLILYAVWEGEYTVTFMNEGNVYHTATVIAGHTVGEITAPEAEEGKRFDYWSLDGTNQFDFNTPINSNITLYSVWSDLEYEVRFYVNDSVYETISVRHGNLLTAPEDPKAEEEDKIFWYWSYEGEKYDLSTPVTADLSLYAVFAASTHNVIFVNGNWISSQTVEHNTPIEKPTDPTNNDATIRFYHWSLTENGKEAYDFSTPVTSNITLYAVWGENRHNVTFVNGEWNAIVSVLNTETVSPISDPEPIEEGDVFSHWSSTEYGEAFDFATPITEDITLYAVWKPVVTYINGTEISKVAYDYGSALIQPENPTTIPEGKRTFSHWSEENGGLIEYEFNNVVLTKDVTLYAVWTQYKIEIVNFGEIIDSYYVVPGAIINQPQPPEESEKVFLYWGTADSLGSEYDFSTPINSDITFYAIYDSYTLRLVNGNAEQIIHYSHGDVLEKPENPDKTAEWQGTFLYWSDADRNKGESEVFGSIVDRDIVLYAVWMPGGITYSTNYNGKIEITDYDNSHEEIIIPYGVEVIGSYAFQDCDNLENIFLPDSITSIGDSAFNGCSALTSIDIPAGVTSINDSAFNGCSALTSIDIPAGVTSIGNSAFDGCSSLTSIEIPKGVTSIENSVFSGCSSLESIDIPERVTSIGDDAFRRCSSLESIDIPAGVTSIGDYAFSGCSALESIDIPAGVTSIGEGVFWGCSSLTSIDIPEGVTSIGDYAFSYCSSLKSIDIPEGVTSIGDYAFTMCELLASVDISKGVMSIGDDAFSNCTSLTNIEIPEGVTSIGESAFFYCSSLNSIDIPEGVTSIGESAFSGCSALESIDIPAGVTSIGKSVFEGCSSLTSIDIPEGVTSIGNYAFGWCLALENIEIPESVESIDICTFSGCFSLSTITIDNTENAIPGSPWGASNATVVWLR